MEILLLREFLKRMEEFVAEDDPYGNGMLIYKKECLTGIVGDYYGTD